CQLLTCNELVCALLDVVNSDVADFIVRGNIASIISLRVINSYLCYLKKFYVINYIFIELTTTPSTSSDINLMLGKIFLYKFLMQRCFLGAL
ncbi:hypothetical protein ACJX0J_029246, partial [Zea mays]